MSTATLGSHAKKERKKKDLNDKQLQKEEWSGSTITKTKGKEKENYKVPSDKPTVPTTPRDTHSSSNGIKSDSSGDDKRWNVSICSKVTVSCWTLPDNGLFCLASSLCSACKLAFPGRWYYFFFSFSSPFVCFQHDTHNTYLFSGNLLLWIYLILILLPPTELKTLFRLLLFTI